MFATKLKEHDQRILMQGIEQGIGKAKIEDARKFKELGVAIDIICKATGLDKETVEKL